MQKFPVSLIRFVHPIPFYSRLVFKADSRVGHSMHPNWCVKHTKTRDFSEWLKLKLPKRINNIEEITAAFIG